MQIQKKWAWFVVVVTTLTFALHGTVVAVFGFHQWTFAVYGLLGLTGFTRLIGRKELGLISFGSGSLVGRRIAEGGSTFFDERDQEIVQRAYRISFAAFWLAFVSASCFLIPFFGPDTLVPLGAITLMVFPAYGFVMLVRHATILILYRIG